MNGYDAPRAGAPSFYIIGAAKSGTTSLAMYLSQHPGIFFPASKEPNYFALADGEASLKGPAPPEVLKEMLYNWSRTDWESYIALFADAKADQTTGEASVRYLYFDRSAARINAARPDARIVAILRNPVDRLISHYNMNRQILLEPLGIEDALAAEDQRVNDGWGWDWHYRRCGQYAEQLRRYFSHFDRDQIAVFLYDDLQNDPADIYRAVCQHIGVDDGFSPDMTGRGMVSSAPRYEWLTRFLWWPNKTRFRMIRYMRPVALPLIHHMKTFNAKPTPAVSTRVRDNLASYLEEETAALEEVLGRRIPWRET